MNGLEGVVKPFLQLGVVGALLLLVAFLVWVVADSRRREEESKEREKALAEAIDGVRRDRKIILGVLDKTTDALVENTAISHQILGHLQAMK